MDDWQDEVEQEIAVNYSALALAVLLQVIHDIKCFYLKIGTKEEQAVGRMNVHWIRKMKGNFVYIASASQLWTVEEIHQNLLAIINQLKTYGRQKIHRVHTKGTGDRIPDLPLVQEERRSEDSYGFTQDKRI